MELRVRATVNTEEGVVIGYYPGGAEGRRRREGEEFVLAKPEDFSHRWMEALDWEPPPPSGPRLPPPGAETALLLDEKHTFEHEQAQVKPRRSRRKAETAQSEE